MTKTQPFLSITETQDPATTDPLGNFYSGIASEETKTTYRKTLREFLFAVKEFSGDFNQRAIDFCKYTKDNPENAKNLLKNYARYLRARTEKPFSDENYLKPTVVPNKFKGIKKFLKMNELPMEWGGIEAIFPEITNVRYTRGYNTEEIRKIVEYCTNPLNKFLILAESSSGVRVGSLHSQTWDNVKPIYPAKNGKYTHDKEKATGNVVCASIIVYEGTSSMYVGLISLEAWDQLLTAKNYWKKKMRREPKPDDPIFISRFGKKFTPQGLKTAVYQIIYSSGIKTPLVEGQRNHEVPVTHGMRKRWNKVMSENSITGDTIGNLIRKERMFGHKIAFTPTENSYFHNTIEESVSQYLQAMPDLMISNEYRQLKHVQEVTEKNQNLTKILQEKETSLQVVRELQAKVERMERYEKSFQFT